ncbi:MAG: VTT domain-containing protein [Betaproteobacteria bacterium]
MLIDWQSTLGWFDAALHGAAAPWVIGLVLALTTLLLEDLALAAGAALAVQGSISWEWAMFSVGAGIALGDLGLYALGVAANRWPNLRRRLALGRAGRAALHLQHRFAAAILLARVIPGLRLLTYTACGFFRLPLAPFCAWVVLAVAVWTVGLMGMGALLGAPLEAAFGIPAPLAVAIPIVVLALGLSLIRRPNGPSTASEVTEAS